MSRLPWWVVLRLELRLRLVPVCVSVFPFLAWLESFLAFLVCVGDGFGFVLVSPWMRKVTWVWCPLVGVFWFVSAGW